MVIDRAQTSCGNAVAGVALVMFGTYLVGWPPRGHLVDKQIFAADAARMLDEFLVRLRGSGLGARRPNRLSGQPPLFPARACYTRISRCRN
ncbi:hypothetical protein I546_1106 [Mycobacterium kansasii 732]|nr:hypothetical protein I546_1106 [Mycobacterium kansasii 732]KZS61173.1 hypothetical protein A4G27_16090 [Mycobacterium kansasii]